MKERHYSCPACVTCTNGMFLNGGQLQEDCAPFIPDGSDCLLRNCLKSISSYYHLITLLMDAKLQVNKLEKNRCQRVGTGCASFHHNMVSDQYDHQKALK